MADTSKTTSLGALMRFSKLFSLLPAVIALCLACNRQPTLDMTGIEPGSPLVSLETPTMLILGKMQGPWRLEKVLSPVKVSLTKENVTQEFRVLGLHPDEYADPSAAAKGNVALEPEEQRRVDEIQSYKIDGLTRILKDVPIWVMAVSEDQPPLAHLFIPQDPAAKAQPGKKAWLVSARALRDGVASMHLDDVPYELRETMLDCQFAAIAESLQETENRAQSANIWSRFDLRLPPPQWDGRLDAMEQALGLSDSAGKPAA